MAKNENTTRLGSTSNLRFRDTYPIDVTRMAHGNPAEADLVGTRAVHFIPKTMLTLRRVVNAWPSLPAEARRSILGIVDNSHLKDRPSP